MAEVGQWKQSPMSLRVYNTLTKTKDVFEPVRPGKVGIYLCGPTVYTSPHIGHMVGPIIFDAVKRYLSYKGYEVTWVVNITDVEDKLINAAAKAGQSVDDLARKYTKEYLDCLADLGIDTIDRFPKASEHIVDIIMMCETLIEKGRAYAAEGSVYFDVTRDDDYGKLSHRRVEEQETGTRVTEQAGKKNPRDFVLWKAAKPGEPLWESPWGPGRPGWHIECSAMSMKYLGKTFDIHGGGMDLLFPHHENELAQSESATDQTFAKYWMHNGLTNLNTKKMSRSEGNVVGARKLIDEYGPELLRYVLLGTHYRSPIEFTEDVITAAKKGLAVFERLFERLARLNAPQVGTGEPFKPEMLEGEYAPFARDVLAMKNRFLESMDDDFNTAGAIGVMHELAGQVNRFIEQNNLEKEALPEPLATAAAATQTLKLLGQTLGLFRVPAKPVVVEEGLTEGLMQLLIQLRATARKDKNFALSDAIRDGLAALKITLEDRPGGTGWKKA